VLDGVNASMGANDLDPDSARDFYKWWQKLGAPLRKLTPGATVCIDHAVKNEENRKQYAAGTGQKLVAVDAHYGIEVTDPFWDRTDRPSDDLAPQGPTRHGSDPRREASPRTRPGSFDRDLQTGPAARPPTRQRMPSTPQRFSFP
jgi:hypothetical protein